MWGKKSVQSTRLELIANVDVFHVGHNPLTTDDE